MGRCLAAYLSDYPDKTIVAGIDPVQPDDLGFPVYPDIDSYCKAADVLIDFSCPEAAQKALLYCAARRIPCVICTTGLTGPVLHTLRFATLETAVFCSENLSLCVSLLRELCREAAQLLGPSFSIDIFESHHRAKKDVPSGTALALAKAVSENNSRRIRTDSLCDRPRQDEEIIFHPLRAGNLVGEHVVLFTGRNEQLCLRHTAYSREVFAEGAIAAAEFVIGKPPGLYKMKDLIKK